MPKQSHQIDDLEQWVKSINDKLENHLVHVAKDISQIQNDLSWVKQFFWLIASTTIVAVVGALLALVLK